MTRKLALVTGASTGIGFELAHVAADEGYDLLIVADEALIEDAAADLRLKNVSVEAIEADLSTIPGVDAVIEQVAGRSLDVVCANAGYGVGGAFLDERVEDWRRSVDTNITGTIYLLNQVLPPMLARRDGKVLVTGSIAGFVPGSFQAVYNGTKAFINSFTEALRNELKDAEGVTITTLMPGATETEFFERGGMLDTRVGAAEKDDPAKVARDGWDAMMAGEARIISGWKNKAIVAASNVIPASILAEQQRTLAEPGGADKA